MLTELLEDLLGEHVHLTLRVVEGDPGDPVDVNVESRIGARRRLRAHDLNYWKTPGTAEDPRGFRTRVSEGLQVRSNRSVLSCESDLRRLAADDRDGDVPVQLRVGELVAGGYPIVPPLLASIPSARPLASVVS